MATGPRITFCPGANSEVLSVLDDNTVTDAARRLLAAERSRQPIRQLSLQYPAMTVEDAYRAWTRGCR